MNTKILISNLGQLKAKYGAGLSKIREAIEQLVSADAIKGIKTDLISVDDPSQMKGVNGQAVTNAASSRQNKEAVDAIYRKLRPDFLVLLGAPDVIPHQDLKNPMFGSRDQDRFAWGDIPYACEAPYSQQAENFVGPSRVIGRIPDIMAGSDPDYLVGLLKTSSEWQTWRAEDYAGHLGISAEAWEQSTQLSLKNIFGHSNLQLSPSSGPRWGASLLKNRPHFINCHGAPSDPHFYGQQGNNYPIAHDASWLNAHVAHGTVAAAECCYGAELYDPAPVTNKQIGICSTYLDRGAYGFFGSTTIAYGPAEGNGAADLICQYFLQQVLSGASLGRAVLEARQQFARSSSELDPADIKTLAQFNLLADPSIQPVNAPAPHEALRLVKAMRTAKAGMEFATVERHNRRRQLFDSGILLTQTQAVASKRIMEKIKPSIDTAMNALAAANGIKSPELISFSVKRPALDMKAVPGMKHIREMNEALSTPSVFHVAIGKLQTNHEKVIQLALLIAKEQDKQLIPVRKLLSR